MALMGFFSRTIGILQKMIFIISALISSIVLWIWKPPTTPSSL
jgi:hypothetical protein